jgi:hypothetical protein
VFTEQRILHIPASFNRGSRCAISQIRYDDCSDLKIQGRSLVVVYKNGDQERFPYIGRREKRKVASLLSGIRKDRPAPDGFHRRVLLCPSCTTPLENDADCCPACKLEFKTAGRARMRALFIPGGGHFYNHYSVPGFLLGLCEIAIFTHLLFNAMALKENMPVNVGAMTLLFCALILEKAAAAFHAGRLTGDRIPESGDYAMRKI